MFNRFESLKQAIKDNSIDKNTLELMIDFYFVKGKLKLSEKDELNNLINPPLKDDIIE